jgi:Phosphate-selective porin O and P
VDVFWFHMLQRLFMLKVSNRILSAVIFAAYFAPTVLASDVDDLKAEMKLMEARHQQEMLILRRMIEQLLSAADTSKAVAEIKPSSLPANSRAIGNAATAIKGTGDLAQIARATPETNLTERLELVEDDLAYILETQEAASVEQSRTDLAIYATIEFESFEDTKTSFDARNIDLFYTSSLNDRLNLGVEIEFERLAQTSAGDRAGEVEVELGWLEYVVNEKLNVRAGIMAVPFARYNSNRFEAFNDLTDRPLMARRIVPTTWSEAGFGIHGSTLVSSTRVEYELYLLNGLTDKISETGLRSARGAFGLDNNSNKAVAGRLLVSPNSFSKIGFSGYQGDYDTLGNKITGWALDGEFNYNKLKLVAEYANFNLDTGLNSDGVLVPEYMRGFYGEASYRFWFKGLNDSFLGRGFSAPTFTFVTRYGEARIADGGDLGLGENREKRFTIGFNYRPVETFVFKLEYQFNTSTGRQLERGNADGFISSIVATF